LHNRPLAQLSYQIELAARYHPHQKAYPPPVDQLTRSSLRDTLSQSTAQTPRQTEIVAMFFFTQTFICCTHLG
jgi:hypothetical protein